MGKFRHTGSIPLNFNSNNPWAAGAGRGDGAANIIPKRSDLAELWSLIHNIQGRGINVDYSGSGINAKISITTPENVQSPGPFFPAIQEGASGSDDKIIIGGCPRAYDAGFASDTKPGRNTATPGVLMLNGKVRLFTDPEEVTLGSSIYSWSTWPSQLLTLKVNSSITPTGTSADRGTYYSYAFIRKIDLATIPDWTYGTYYYFPLGWITVAYDGSDKYIQSISWANTGWILQGSATSSGVVLMKITGLHSDSPTSGIRMYKGDIYGNGSAAYRTQTNVTVRIPNIAANVTLPSTGTWTDVPACGGISTVATWVGATTTHTNDTVYEAIGLLIIW